MKKQLLLLWACFACSFANGQILNYYQDGNFIFNDTNKILVEDLLDRYKDQFGLGVDDEFELYGQSFVRLDTMNELNRGCVQTSYKQYYKGYEVEGTAFNITSKCGVALVANGSLRTGLDIDGDDVMIEGRALDSALANISTHLWYSWEDSSREEGFKKFDRTSTSFPTGKLVIAKKFGTYDTVSNYALCWKFDISWYDTTMVDTTMDTTLKSATFYVNASNGELHTIHNNSTGAVGHLQTTYDGYRENAILTKCSDFMCWTYKLTDEVRKVTTRKFDGYFSEMDPEDNNNNWVEAINQPSATAHWAAARAWDYFTVRHGNQRTFETLIYTGASPALSLGLAASEPFGIHELIYVVASSDYSRVTLDVLAHEFTHGVIRNSAGKIGDDESFEESFAINEGLCDIFAMCSERYTRGYVDWTIGENMMPNFKRNFNDPSNDIPYNHGDTYQVGYYYSDGAYGKSGPLRRWFNHLSQGEWTWTPAYSGVGIYDAESITYITMMWWLWQNAGYHDMRNQTLAVADVYYGNCSHTWKSVQKAWADVGVGNTTYCRPTRLDGSVVVAQTDMDVSGITPRFKVVSNLIENEDTTFGSVLNYNWILPAGWDVDYNFDSSEIEIVRVPNFSSKYVSVVVTYVRGNDTTSDTLRNVLHFAEECNDASVSSRMAQNQGTSPGISKISKNGATISIYPNPVSTELNVTLSEAAQLTLCNLSGQEVYKASLKNGDNKLALPALPTGVYVVRIINSRLNEVRKIQLTQ